MESLNTAAVKGYPGFLRDKFVKLRYTMKETSPYYFFAFWREDAPVLFVQFWIENPEIEV